MMVFGKQCPACGGKELTARPWGAWLAMLPTVRAYVCNRCQQALVFLFPFAIAIELRQLPRITLPSFFLVRIADGSSQYARINNISTSGLSFTQPYSAGGRSRGLLMLDLYNSNDGSSLEQLPAEIVTCSEQLLVVNGTKTTVRNCCVRFVNLNQAQQKVLATCLDQYGQPCPEPDSLRSR